MYNETGLAPEFTVEYDGAREPDPTNYASTEDAQLRKAVEVISSKAAAAAETPASEQQ